MALNLSPEPLARRCARRPWLTIGLWVVLLVISIGLRAALFENGVTAEFDFTNEPESKRGDNLLEDRLRGPKGTNEVVIIASETQTVEDQEFRDTVVSLFDKLVALGPKVIRLPTLTNFSRDGGGFLVSRDGRTTIIPFTMAGDFDDSSDNIVRGIDVVDEFKASSEFKILMTGQATVGEDFREISQEGLLKGEAFGIPIAIIILVAVFGALVAVLIPVVVAAASITVAMGAASLLGLVFGLSFFVENIITMIGLAVGIDYSLFFRRPLPGGASPWPGQARSHRAGRRHGGTNGGVQRDGGVPGIDRDASRSLQRFHQHRPRGNIRGHRRGPGFHDPVACSALLGLLGDGINRLSIPLIGRSQARDDETRPGGFWDRVSRGVMRQPAISLLLAGGILVAAVVPFFDINTGAAGVSTFPDGIESKEAFLILDREFSAGEVTPVEIVIDGKISSEPVQAGIVRLTDFLKADEVFSAPRPLQVNPAGDLALLTVPVAGDAVSQESQDAITRLRDFVPKAFPGDGAEISVAGETAFNMDFFSMARNAAFIVFPVVLGISFLLLMLVFRSIVVPVKAILLNLLSVGATYGILVMVFQKGWGNDTFGFQQAETIEAWIPIFLFAILFGLSMDYHVFLLSRIRERFDQTQDNTGSVAFGIRSTGRIITGAALIMVAVFWGFAAGDLVPLQQMGFGLGIAILLDASIVRMVLVPASMRLLGKWNWYLPPWLQWLPDLRVEPERAPAEA